MHSPTRARAHTQKYALVAFHGKNGFMNSPQRYAVRTLPVLFIVTTRVVDLDE
jgi:hypothetical protein